MTGKFTNPDDFNYLEFEVIESTKNRRIKVFGLEVMPK